MTQIDEILEKLNDEQIKPVLQTEGAVLVLAATYLGGNGSTFHAYHNVDKYGNKKKGIFYQHYHPCYPYVHGTAHSFFGTPYVNI